MKPRLSCAETFRHLDDYLDRELAAGDTQAVEEHLQACADCSGEFEVERELLERIRAKLARVKVPDSLRARISELLARE